LNILNFSRKIKYNISEIKTMNKNKFFLTIDIFYLQLAVDGALILNGNIKFLFLTGTIIIQ